MTIYRIRDDRLEAVTMSVKCERCNRQTYTLFGSMSFCLNCVSEGAKRMISENTCQTCSTKIPIYDNYCGPCAREFVRDEV